MGLGDRAADRQSHTDPVGFGRVEGLEQAVQFLRIEARAGVLHLDEHIVPIIYARYDLEFPRSVAGASHGFNSIDDQIYHYLLQLDAICRNERQIMSKPPLQLDAGTLHLGLSQSDDLADRFIDVQEVPTRRHFLHKRTDAANDFARSSAVPDDTAERLPHFVEIRLRRAEPAQNPHWRW